MQAQAVVSWPTEQARVCTANVEHDLQLLQVEAAVAAEAVEYRPAPQLTQPPAVAKPEPVK